MQACHKEIAIDLDLHCEAIGGSASSVGLCRKKREGKEEASLSPFSPPSHRRPRDPTVAELAADGIGSTVLLHGSPKEAPDTVGMGALGSLITRFQTMGTQENSLQVYRMCS